MGAPLNNKSAIRHGLTSGGLPRGASYVVTITNELRRGIEAAVLQVRGQIGVYEAGVIQTAIRWERHGLLAQRWLRKHFEELDPEQRLTFSREIAKASESRDRCLKALGLDRLLEDDDFATLYSRPVEALASSVACSNGNSVSREAASPNNAPGASLCDAGGCEESQQKECL